MTHDLLRSGFNTLYPVLCPAKLLRLVSVAYSSRWLLRRVHLGIWLMWSGFACSEPSQYEVFIRTVVFLGDGYSWESSQLAFLTSSLSILEKCDLIILVHDFRWWDTVISILLYMLMFKIILRNWDKRCVNLFSFKSKWYILEVRYLGLWH